MMIPKAKGELWDIIAEGKHNYRLREAGVYLEGVTWDKALSVARVMAETAKKPVILDAFYEEQWYQLDIAYPAEYSS